MRILIALADPATSERVVRGFEEQGYIVDCTSSAARAVEIALGQEPDAIILGRELADGGGVEACRAMRQAGIGAPAMILAEVDGTEPVVKALDAGADDYVAKPVAFEELAARIRAMVRRCKADEGAILRYEGIEVDVAKHTVTMGGEVIVLTAREFALLEYLMRNRQRVVPRSTLAERVWGVDDRSDNSNVIDVYMSRLRRKLPQAREMFRSVHGLGYMLAKPS